MSQYVMVYIGGDTPKTPEEGKKHFADYMQWIQSLGDAAVSPMNPLKGTVTVNPDGSVSQGGSSQMSGYTIVEAESMEAALDMAKTCPFLTINGQLEVSERIEMPS
ncbi:YciI family protein [Reinekea forsetii]|nr:YciI family protein [Reinekea forsetii]